MLDRVILTLLSISVNTFLPVSHKICIYHSVIFTYVLCFLTCFLWFKPVFSPSFVKSFYGSVFHHLIN